MTLKTKFKFIEFVAYKDNAWACVNKHRETLGGVSYYKDWKQFIFEPVQGTVFSALCLSDIYDFVHALNEGEK
jgi:hypothetical protein